MCLVLLSKLCITYTLSPQFVINIKREDWIYVKH